MLVRTSLVRIRRIFGDIITPSPTLFMMEQCQTLELDTDTKYPKSFKKSMNCVCNFFADVRIFTISLYHCFFVLSLAKTNSSTLF